MGSTWLTQFQTTLHRGLSGALVRRKTQRGQALLVRRALGSSRRGWSREKRDHEAEKPMMSDERVAGGPI